MSDCIFCQIGQGSIPAKEIYRDDKVVAFHDLNPQAPIHILVIPSTHFATYFQMSTSQPDLAETVMAVASRIGDEQAGDSGYRLVINTGDDGGQTVGHVHVHVLGGRPMLWPPG